MNLKIYSENMLPTDSSEYELLIEAATMGATIPGMGCEIGLRRGGGSRMIMDAFIAAGAFKTHVMVDPYGNIEYMATEKQPTRCDYTNDMRADCMAELFTYYKGKPVNPIFLNMEDSEFFERYSGGVPTYSDEGKTIQNRYCTVHLDGPHDSDVVNNEASWFQSRMLPGATLVCDDTDYYPHWEKSHGHIMSLGFALHKRGVKKAVYVKT